MVSDSMTYSGMPPGVYESPATGKVRLTAEGKLHMEGDPGTLAGSASNLMDGIRKITDLENFPFAWNMASVHPNRLMGSPEAQGIQAGAPASLVLMNQEGLVPGIQSVICKGMVQDT
jgi:N-acetylglucosamine-6-phosphate deacetylase